MNLSGFNNCIQLITTVELYIILLTRLKSPYFWLKWNLSITTEKKHMDWIIQTADLLVVICNLYNTNGKQIINLIALTHQNTKSFVNI